MDLGSLLVGIAVVELAALLITVGFVLAHVVWLKLDSARFHTPRVRAREALNMMLASDGSSEWARRRLEALPWRHVVGIVLDVTRSLSLPERQRIARTAAPEEMAAQAERMCASRRWHIRLKGARVLTALGVGEANVPTLFNDPHPVVRAQAAEWASYRSDPEIVSRLVDMLGDVSGQCRFAAQNALLAVGTPAVGPLVRFLSSPRPAGVADAMEVAAYIADSRFLPSMILHSKSSDARVRAEAAWALGAVGGKEAAARLERLLDDPSAVVRGAASGALGAMGHWPSVAAIGRLLDDPVWEARSGAARALQALGDPGAVVLRRAIRSGTATQGDIARQALGVHVDAVELEAAT